MPEPCLGQDNVGSETVWDYVRLFAGGALVLLLGVSVALAGYVQRGRWRGKNG